MAKNKSKKSSSKKANVVSHKFTKGDKVWLEGRSDPFIFIKYNGDMSSAHIMYNTGAMFWEATENLLDTPQTDRIIWKSDLT